MIRTDILSSSYRNLLTKIPPPIKKRGKDYASAVAAILLATLLIALAIKPTAITIAGLVGEIKAREAANQKLQRKIDQIINAQIAYTQIYNQLPLVNQALPENPQFAPLIRQIEAERILTDLNLTSLNYSSITLAGKPKKRTHRNTGLRRISFSASMKGDYPNFKDFLKDTLSYRRIVHINNFEIQQAKSKHKETNHLIISLTGNAFYLNHRR